MDPRLHAPDELATSQWELVKACIDLAIRDAVLESGTNRCFHGSPSSGYWFALDHARSDPHQPDLVPDDRRAAMVHYRLPPITPNRRCLEPAALENHLGDQVEVFDPWGEYGGDGFELQGLYAAWVDAVEHAFATRSRRRRGGLTVVS